MALDWHRPAGKSTRDGICRSLARKGLDIFDMAGVAVVAGSNFSSRHVIEGGVHNYVEETLGARKYQEICKQPVALRNIHYCQSGFSFTDGYHNAHKVLPPPPGGTPSAVPAKPSLINHDYLVVELAYNDDESLFLRAEKTGHPPEQAGIVVTVDDSFDDSKSSVCLFSIRCFGRDIGRLPEVVEMLVDFSSEYSLRDHNCWQYTRRMARRLVRACRQRGNGTEEEEEVDRMLVVEEESVERRVVSLH